MRLEHGEHNEELCDCLLENARGRFNDWIVTTAFYACIHFVEHGIFPAKLEGREFATFDDYSRHRQKERRDYRSKHALKADLVETKLPRANRQYRLLKDLCMKVRYRDYLVSDKKAKVANRMMKEVKKTIIALLALLPLAGSSQNITMVELVGFLKKDIGTVEEIMSIKSLRENREPLVR